MKQNQINSYMCICSEYSTGWLKKTLTTLSMLCRMANWSLFKKEPMSGNARCGCSRTSKLENWCHSFWSPKQLCNPLAIDVTVITFLHMRYSFILNEVRFVVFECSEIVGSIRQVPVHNSRNDRHSARIYGKADCNGRAAARLYAERFQNRHTPHHSSFRGHWATTKKSRKVSHMYIAE